MTEARYDSIAASYVTRPDGYSAPPTRALLDLAGPVRGLRILDLACGHGALARELARRGGRVTGVDLSGELLAAGRAREEAEPLGIAYVHADASSPDVVTGPLGAEAFDGVACSFGLSDIDALEPVLGNVAHLLREGGWFVFSILHPCFPGVEGVSSAWPEGSGYYDECWWVAAGELSTIRRVVGANHRTLSTYLNALTGSGLIIDEVREPRPDEEWTSSRPGVELLPVYLVVRCRRCSSVEPQVTTSV